MTRTIAILVAIWLAPIPSALLAGVGDWYLGLWGVVRSIAAGEVAWQDVLGGTTAIVFGGLCLIAIRLTPGTPAAFGWSKRGGLDDARQFLVKAPGVVLGSIDGKILRDTSPGPVIVAKPTRAGKGTGVVVPTLLEWPDHALVLDIKGELWDITSKARSRHGPCYFLDITRLCHGYNPILDLRSGADVHAMARAFIPADDESSQIWRDAGTVALTALIDHARAIGDTSLSGVRRAAADLQKIKGSPSAMADEALRELQSYEDRVLSSIRMTVSMNLQSTMEPETQRVLRQSDFSSFDFLRSDQATTVYLHCPLAHLDRLSGVIRIILTQIMGTFTATLDERRRPLLAMLDEMPRLGRVEMIETMCSAGAGYGLKPVLVCQSLAQIAGVYGQASAIIPNANSAVIVPGAVGEDGLQIARQIGAATEYRVQQDWTLREHTAEILPASEIREMQGQAILVQRGGKMIVVDQEPYFQNKTWRAAVGGLDRQYVLDASQPVPHVGF